MIEANVLKGIQEILGDRYVDPQQEETIGPYLARTLKITEQQAHTFLAALERGSTIDDATVEAGIDSTSDNGEMLKSVARTIGGALGSLRGHWM